MQIFERRKNVKEVDAHVDLYARSKVKTCPKNSRYTGARYNRVRNFGRCFSGYCNYGNNGFPSKITRTLGANSKRHLWLITRSKLANFVRAQRFNLGKRIVQTLLGTNGQSSAEYAVVASISVGIVVALGLLSNSLEAGLFVQHAIESASHNVSDAFGGIVDVFCY